VRLANTFGPRSNIRSPEFGFMNYFIGLALAGKDVPVFGEGAQQRNLTYVDDSVSALLAAATQETSDGGVFFAVGDRQMPVRDIAEAVCRNIGGRVVNVPWPKDREVIEIGDAVISNERIRAALGWTPQVDLDAGGGWVQRKDILGGEDTFSMARTGARYKHGFTEKAYFEARGAYLFNLEDGDDSQGNAALSLVAPIAGKFAMKLAYDVFYRNKPLPGFEKTDTTFGAGIQFAN